MIRRIRRLLLILLLASPCFGQTLVQQGGNNSAVAGTTLAQSAAFASVATGDTVVVFGATGNSTTHSAPTDSTGSNTYVQCTGSPQTVSTSRISCWQKVNVTGGSSFSVTFNSASDAERAMIVLDYSGISAVDTGAGSTTAVTGTPTVTIVPGAAGKLIVAAFTGNSTIGSAYPAGTNYTSRREEPSNGDFSTHVPLFAEDRTSAPSGSQTATGGASVTNGYAMIAASFTPSSAGPNVGFKGKVGLVGKVGIL